MTDVPTHLFGPLSEESTPVFSAPWEAQAFAITLKLHESGLFTWDEWAETLSAEIYGAQEAGDPDLGDTYYLHWQRALERITEEKGATKAEEVETRTEQWRQAYLATPHGEPVSLDVLSGE